MNAGHQNIPANVQEVATVQIAQQQERDSYWGAPLPYVPAQAQVPIASASSPENELKAMAGTFSKVSLALIVLGLVLLAASIVPLMVYFEMPRALGILAFDLLLMAGALVLAGLGFANSSQMTRRVGLVLVLCTVGKVMVLDTWGLDSLTKAIAYISGGAVCMAIGFLYSSAVKRLSKESAEQ